MSRIPLDMQIEAVRAEADFAASYAATAAIDRLNGKSARQRAEALKAAVASLQSIQALQHQQPVRLALLGCELDEVPA